MVCDSQEEARSFPRGDFRLALCQECGLFSNVAFQAESMRYSEKYDNAQTYSPFYWSCLVGVADNLKAQHHLQNKTVVDIGCGKGEFLGMLCPGGVNRGIGIDPSYVGPDTAEEGAIRFTKAFFDPQLCDAPPDLVCCRHVLDHVQHPVSFLQKIRQVFGGSKGGVLYIETPDARSIFAEGRFWDLYYEHPSYFTPEVLTRLLGMAGFQVIRQRAIFGNQYLAVEAVSVSTARHSGAMGNEELARFEAWAANFRNGFERRVQWFRETAGIPGPQGGVRALGSGGQGSNYREHGGSGGENHQISGQHQSGEAEQVYPGVWPPHSAARLP